MNTGPRSTFKQSLSVTLPAFINKCGSIGLELIPMLLVIKKLAPFEASMVIGAIKSAMFVGGFFGGWLSDRVGVRTSFVVSFLISGIGMSVLPFTSQTAVMCVFGALAQVGVSMFPSTARLMVFELLPKTQQQEGVGWLKSANNLGSVVSYMIAGLASTFGFMALMLFDAICSFGAALAGRIILRSAKYTHPLKPSVPLNPSTSKDWSLFILIVLVVAFEMFIYSMFMVAAPALCQLYYGDNGLKTFSSLMLINTVLCSVFAVYASRRVKNPYVSILLGAFLNGLGFLLVVLFAKDKIFLLCAVFILTLGELLFSSMAPYLVARLTPDNKNKGSTFGTAMVVQNIGRFAGSTLAFPLIVYGTYPWFVIGLTAVAVMLTGLVFCSQYKKNSQIET